MTRRILRNNGDACTGSRLRITGTRRRSRSGARYRRHARKGHVDNHPAPETPLGSPTARRRRGRGLGAREAVEGLPGFALGGFGVAGAAPGVGQVGTRAGEPLFEIADFGFQSVFRGDGSGCGGCGRRHGPFGIPEDLAAVDGCFLSRRGRSSGRGLRD